MTHPERQETFVKQTITYTLDKDGRLFVIENVPARVCLETGEQLFAPETVERLQQTIWSGKTPVRVLESPVYEFAV
jgi:YgiT-type zinc finger domain-containing protein